MDEDTKKLLDLGWYVIENRSRNLNKDLGPWYPTASFKYEADAEQYYEEYNSIGYMRIVKP